MAFYIVTEEFATANNGRRTTSGGRGLFFRQDKLGRWVINVEAATIFRSLDYSSFPIEELAIEDFPQEEP